MGCNGWEPGATKHIQLTRSFLSGTLDNAKKLDEVMFQNAVCKGRKTVARFQLNHNFFEGRIEGLDRLNLGPRPYALYPCTKLSLTRQLSAIVSKIIY